MGGFFTENSLNNVGGFLAGFAHRTCSFCHFNVFLSTFAPKIAELHQNFDIYFGNSIIVVS